ncbi:MAG: peptidyl-prolyl cis-trans isomerase [Acidobacteria bacterium]|nr:peptidyl-prolyl cis-trans isomerase [Acidobacteriota bacterium]
MAEETNPRVVMETSKGAITLELDPAKAPKTVANFLSYVDAEHYDGTIFHRVISNFMIQGGGFDERMMERETGDPIENEADNGLSNEKGTIAMARTSDPHSATAQFFINATDTNDFLDHTSKTPRGWGYCVFGKVVDGLDVVDSIRQVKTGRRGMHDDVPSEPVVIKTARRA